MKNTFVWLAMAFAALAVVPVTAEAHGPTRQKVTETIEINAPADKVWAVVGNFQDMSWHPAVEKTEGEGGNEAGAKRVLTLGPDALIKETLNKYEDGKVYAYEITDVDVKVLPVKNYSARITVEEADGKTTVTWRGAFYRGYLNNDPPEELNDATAIKAVTGVFKSGLEALKAKVESAG